MYLILLIVLLVLLFGSGYYGYSRWNGGAPGAAPGPVAGGGVPNLLWIILIVVVVLVLFGGLGLHRLYL